MQAFQAAVSSLSQGKSGDTASTAQAAQPRLTVRLQSFRESNGMRNWTATLARVDAWDGLIGSCGGITIDRGEFWNRVAYEAERAKFLIGERTTEPDILDYAKDICTPEEWAGERGAAGTACEPITTIPADVAGASTPSEIALGDQINAGSLPEWREVLFREVAQGQEFKTHASSRGVLARDCSGYRGDRGHITTLDPEMPVLVRERRS